MVTSLTLNEKWDIFLDTNNNLAVSDGKERANQDVCTGIRLFEGEALLDPAKGIPYFDSVLGGRPGSALIVAYMRKEALKVPGVTDVSFAALEASGREIKADINIVYEG